MGADPCTAPAVYFLDRVQEVGQTGSLTSYNMSANWAGKGCSDAVFRRVTEVQQIVVSSMKMDPESWKKVTRHA